MKHDEKLIAEIEKKKSEYRADSYPMSIGELTSLYEKKEIIVNPDFQRLYRWSHTQKVRLIESILLGIPLPAIFVYQNEEGVWELVDGLQRVSTILQFMGILKGYEPLKLEGTKYLPSLEGIVWESKSNKDIEMPQSLKLHVKRSKLNFSIILSDSGPKAKYEVFQRLNTGGSFASNQEIRNCIMVMVDKEIFKWLNTLANNKNFLNAISLSQRLIDEQYHLELALRFIALRYFTYNFQKDVGDNLDDTTEVLLNNESAFPFKKVGKDFEMLFEILFEIFEDNVFKKHDGKGFKGKFLESLFEAIAVGVSNNITKYSFPRDNELLYDKVVALSQNKTFLENSGSGSNAKQRIQKIIPFAIKHFAR